MRGAVVCLVLALASTVSAAAVGRIVGGQETSISQYPFMANILHSYDGSFYMPACAGAILTTRTVLTTASCWPDRNGAIQIRVGSSNATSGGTVLTIIRMTFLAIYNPITLENDIALVNPQTDIKFVPNAVMPIGYASVTTIIPDNSLATIAGWGRTENSFYSEQLRHVEVRTINNRDCESLYAFSGVVNSGNNMMCVTARQPFPGQPVPDACVGDNDFQKISD